MALRFEKKIKALKLKAKVDDKVKAMKNIVNKGFLKQVTSNKIVVSKKVQVLNVMKKSSAKPSVSKKPAAFDVDDFPPSEFEESHIGPVLQ